MSETGLIFTVVQRVVCVSCADNNSESSANSLPLFAMSGDGQNDVVIAMVFLFGAEARQLMDALRVHVHLVVYVGETAKQSSTSFTHTHVLCTKSVIYVGIDSIPAAAIF